MVKNMSENERAAQTIEWDVDGRPVVPDKPIISFIEGDGIGPDIWAAARPVFDAAVRKAYGGKDVSFGMNCWLEKKLRNFMDLILACQKGHWKI